MKLDVVLSAENANRIHLKHPEFRSIMLRHHSEFEGIGVPSFASANTLCLMDL
jgi:hypothetical protein